MQHASIARARLLVLVSLVAAAAALAAEEPRWHLSRGNLALGGYDAVAYFRTEKAVKGSPAFEIEWAGARWRFASADARDEFVRAPERFAPQFGGYCAYAVSQGYTASGDPEAWTIADGRLYINYSKSVRRLWERRMRDYIESGVANWPAVLRK